MVNPEKVRLMSDISILRDKESYSIKITELFFKGDYITKHMLGSFFSYSLCFLLFIILVILYKLEEILNLVDYHDAIDIFKGYIAFYVIGLVAYELITLIVCGIKYDKALKIRKSYATKLRRLEKKIS